MRNSNAVIVRALAAAMQSKILPELQTESSRQAAQTALGLLGLLLSRETSTVVVDATERYQELYGRMQAVIARYEGAVPSMVRINPVPFLGGDRLADDHVRLLHTQELVRQAAARLIEIRDGVVSAEIGPTVEQLLGELANTEVAITQQFLASLAPAPAAVDVRRPIEVTRETLQTYLRERFPDRVNLTVADFAGAGFSMGKQIRFFNMQDASGKPEELVMRQEQHVGIYKGDSTLIRNEYQLIKCAYKLGLRAPEPLWLDTSGKLGPDFMVMRKIQGRQIGEPFREFRPLNEELIMDIGGLLAKLHGAGLEPFADFLEQTGQQAVKTMDIRQATIYRVTAWEKFCDGENDYPNPGRTWLFDWLKKNAPENSHRPVMVHGDFGIHNLLEENNRITACLDWEWGHPGGPSEDLAYIRPHVDKYSSWERFTNHYLAHGGPSIEIDERAMRYNACLSNAIFSALGGPLAWHAGNGGRGDLTSVYAANCYAFQFQQMAMESALKSSGVSTDSKEQA